MQQRDGESEGKRASETEGVRGNTGRDGDNVVCVLVYARDVFRGCEGQFGNVFHVCLNVCRLHGKVLVGGHVLFVLFCVRHVEHDSSGRLFWGCFGGGMSFGGNAWFSRASTMLCGFNRGSAICTTTICTHVADFMCGSVL